MPVGRTTGESQGFAYVIFQREGDAIDARKEGQQMIGGRMATIMACKPKPAMEVNSEFWFFAFNYFLFVVFNNTLLQAT